MRFYPISVKMISPDDGLERMLHMRWLDVAEETVYADPLRREKR
jgi:hypothetical protein